MLVVTHHDLSVESFNFSSSFCTILQCVDFWYKLSYLNLFMIVDGSYFIYSLSMPRTLFLHFQKPPVTFAKYFSLFTRFHFLISHGPDGKKSFLTFYLKGKKEYRKCFRSFLLPQKNKKKRKDKKNRNEWLYHMSIQIKCFFFFEKNNRFWY